MTTDPQQFDQQIPLLIRNVENALRAGYSLKQAFGIVAQDLTPPLSTEAGQVVADLEARVPLPQALDRWLARVPSDDLNLVVATIGVQLEVGGNLADKLNLLGQIMDKRADLHNT